MTQRILRKNRIRKSLGSRVFDGFNYTFFVLCGLVMILPFWSVIVISITSNGEFLRTPFLIFPKKPTLEAYQYILSTPLIPRAYGITALVTVSGTALSLLVNSMLSYGLSKPRLHGRKFFIIYLLITMFFSGGLIPTYLLVRNTLHLDNKLFSLFLPGTVNVFHFVIMRSFFQQMPASLEESAKIDGAGDFRILFRIIYPLAIPTLTTIALFVAVGLWNSWFNANLYLRDSRLFPLQLVIRNYILKANKPAEMQLSPGIRDAAGNLVTLSEEGIKMACVAASVVPLLCFYPFLQKYFVKGVMLGSMKG